MYDVVFYNKAKGQLSKLALDIQKRILNTLERIKIRPFHFIKRKEGTSYYILRIGNHRAILDVKKENSLIFVVEVGHRKNIYKF